MIRLYGHDAPLRTFMSAMRGPRLHHAWLLTGPEGVGKASAALILATRMLAEAAGPPPGGDDLSVPPEHPMARLIAAHSHPDLKRLERLPKDTKLLERGRNDWPEDAELARSISVDQVRALGASFANAPGMSGRRLVIIDSVDDLERGGANALLKNLEEPPAGTIFLLVSHAPGRLLPTIRSRCRTLRFGPLDNGAMTSVLAAHMPELDDQERRALLVAGQGSPGRAMHFAGLDIGGIDAVLDRLAREGDPGNALRTALAAKLASKSAQQRYEAFLARVPAFIAGQARNRQGEALGEILAVWERARDLAQSAVSGSLDVTSVVHTLCGQVATLAPRGKNAKA